MRNWPYAYALGNSADAPIKGKFDVAPLPAGTGEGARPVATLGGWNLAVSKYSNHADAAIDHGPDPLAATPPPAPEAPPASPRKVTSTFFSSHL